VLGSNLGGGTSALLSSNAAASAIARAARLDILYPLSGRKRARSWDDGFEFTYPASWLADATVARRAADAGERARPLDPLAADPRRPPRRRVAEPVVAYGPPGSSGEVNVSVVVAPIEPGFELASLGAPAAAARAFLWQIAPDGSGRTATLLSASERVDAAGTVYYVWSYRLAGPTFDRVNWSAVAARGPRGGAGGRPTPPQLLTLNAQAPASKVDALGDALAGCAASFEVDRAT
jgi:hypothetical protein